MDGSQNRSQLKTIQSRTDTKRFFSRMIDAIRTFEFAAMRRDDHKASVVVAKLG